jgi:hypothetical protein
VTAPDSVAPATCARNGVEIRIPSPRKKVSALQFILDAVLMHVCFRNRAISVSNLFRSKNSRVIVCQRLGGARQVGGGKLPHGRNFRQLVACRSEFVSMRQTASFGRGSVSNAYYRAEPRPPEAVLMLRLRQTTSGQTVAVFDSDAAVCRRALRPPPNSEESSLIFSRVELGTIRAPANTCFFAAGFCF